ncbi:MAG: PKD-like domain-containing protein, partial [Bacteroidales bacterium]
MKAQTLLFSKRNLVVLVTLIVANLWSVSLHAFTIYSKAAGGAWNSVATWTAAPGGTVSYKIPVAGDIVYIEGGATVTVPSGYTAACATLYIGSTLPKSGTLTLASTTSLLNVSGNVEVGGTGGTNPDYATGTINLSGGAIITIGGSITLGITDQNHNGSLIFNTSGTSSTLKVGGAFTVNYYNTFTAGNGTIEFNGAAQTVPSISKLGTFFNLTLSGSGIKTTNSVAYNGTLRMGGSATANNTITAGSSAKIIYQGTVAQTTGPEFGALTGTPLARTFGGTGGVTINNAAGVTLGSNTTITNILTLTAGNLNIVDNVLTLLGGPIAGTGTNLQSTSGSSLKFISNTANLYVPGSVHDLDELAITSSSGLRLDGNVTCTTLTLIGKITTGANVLTADAVSGAPGTANYVYGNLSHVFPAGSSSFMFTIGDANYYTPVNLSFDEVFTPGAVTGYTTPSLHGDIANAGLKLPTVLNRIWNLTPDGTIDFSMYTIEPFFVSQDYPGDGNYVNYVVRKYDGAWEAPTCPNHNEFSTVATNMVTFSDYVIGEGYTDAAKSELTPLLSTIIADGVATQMLTVTARDAYGHLVGGGGASVTIEKDSGDGTIGPVTDNRDGTYTALVTSPTFISSGDFVAKLDGNWVKNGGGDLDPATIAQVDYIAGPGAGHYTTLTPVSQTINADGTSTAVLTVTSYDQHNNPGRPGEDYVEIWGLSGTCSGSGTQYADYIGSVGNISVVTNNGTDNVYTIVVTAPTAACYDVFVAKVNGEEVKSGGAVQTHATVNYVAGPVDHFVLTLASCQKNGVPFTGTNTLTAYDVNNNICLPFDASANNVSFTAGPADGTISGLGSGSNNVLNQAGDFVNGVANLTSDLTFTGTLGIHTFTATSANGKTGISGDVTILPVDIITSSATANWCQAVSNTYTITSGADPAPTYSWSRASVAGITPSTGSGTGSSITETLLNPTANPIVVHYLITPTVNGCTGSVFDLAVTVNPTAIITSVATAPGRCNNVSTTYTATSSTTGAVFSWARAAVTGISNAAASGTGADITEALVNTTANPVNIHYLITPSINGCTGTTKDVVLTVNPTAVITSSSTANYCNNTPYTYNITSSSNTPTPSYAWSRAEVSGITPSTYSGTGASITETLVNSTVNPVVVHYLVTPTVNGCAGTTLDVAVTVNPTSIITSASAVNWCNDVSNTYNIVSSSNSPTPSYAWSRASVAGISNAANSGTGSAITETLQNTTYNPIDIQYIITPTVNGCTGTTKYVTVTVNPTSVITSDATVNWCSSVSNTYNIISSSSSPTPDYSWTRSSVTGISPSTGSGTGAAITETLVNSTVNPIVVHYTITPTVNGCNGTPFDLAVTVNPISVITSSATANWCNNVSNTYNVTSSSNSPTPVYTWERAEVTGITPVTGSGTGAAIIETLVNSTSNPIVVHYLITPTVNGCAGTTKDVAVTVNPTSVITSSATANWCNNVSNTYNITSSSNTPTPDYSWSRAAVTGISPSTGSGTGASITETLVNSTVNPIVVHYLVTPTVNGCAGTTKDVSVTVNPTSVITSSATANYCNNTEYTYSITSSSNTPTPSYSWSRAEVSGVSPASNSGTGASITETLVNSTVNPIVVHYLIIPTVNGCAGTTKDVTVTVNPTSVITSSATANWCNNVSNTYNITSSSASPTPSYSWSRAAVTGITNAANSGTGATITETLVNSTVDAIVVHYLVTPTVNGCAGTTKDVAVTVNPTSVITSDATLNWCSSVSNTYNIESSSTSPAPTYSWTRASVTGITPSSGSGTGNAITETLVNSTPDALVVHYLITPSVNGCAGTTKDVSVIINPTSVITSAGTANWCNNVSNTYNILSSTSPAPDYSWSRAEVTGITPATTSGTGATITETLVNSTSNPIVVHYLIT